jgi:3-oxoacyl-[acyl-carrier protein] reductase
MSDTMSPRVALVTGGSGGIGRAVVERLAGDGFAVAVHRADRDDAADRLVEEITEAGGRAIAIGGDIADEHAMAAAFDAVEAAFGGIDVLVHTDPVRLLAPLSDLDPDDAFRTYGTGGRGTSGADRQAARRLREGGAVIDFSMSVTGIHVPAQRAYGAGGPSILVLEPHGRDITVHAVAPRPTTAPLDFEGKDGATAENAGNVPGAVPLECLGRPERIAEIVALLAGPAAQPIRDGRRAEEPPHPMEEPPHPMREKERDHR